MVNFGGNMELTLHGSQISLATRDKVQTPPIFYPPVYIQNRPGSASLHSTQRNRFVAKNCVSTKKRPLSADSRFIRNNLKETHRVKFDLDKKTSTSSNNILKLLLDDPVSKYWNHKNQRSMKNNKEMNDDSTSCGDSIEEDVQTVKMMEIHDEEKEEVKIEDIKSDEWGGGKSQENDEKDSQNSGSLDEKSQISPFKMGTIKRPDSLKLTLDFGRNIRGSDSGFERSSVSNDKESNLSFGSNGVGSSKHSNVSFSLNNEAGKSESSKNPYDLWVNENSSKSKSLDLPGRVSFSTSDVYEIDYSDYDDQESEPIYQKPNTVPVDDEKDNKKKEYVKEHYMESNSDNEYENEDYKRNGVGGRKVSEKIERNLKDLREKNLKENERKMQEKEKRIYEFEAEMREVRELNLRELRERNIKELREENLKEQKRKENERNFKESERKLQESDGNNDKGHYEVNQIIEDYKKEIASLNQRHETEFKKFEPKKLNNNLKFEINFDDLQNEELNIKKHFIDEDDEDEFYQDEANNKKSVLKNYYEQEEDDSSNARKTVTKNSKINKSNKNLVWEKNSQKIDSSNPVIKNYLKTKESDIEKLNNRVTITTANKRLNDLSKKPTKSAKDSNGGKTKSTVGSQQKNLPRISSAEKKKLKSPIPCMREDSNLDEFQIEKVVSWMSVHEENFSEFDFSVKNDSSVIPGKEISMRVEPVVIERPSSMIQDTTYQDIVSIIKEIDQDKKDSSDFKSLKTDVEFKLNTILNSIESDESQSPIEETVQDPNDKLKEIFSYLDKVDSNCDKVLISSKNIASDSDHQELEFALEPDVIEDVPKIADLLVLPNHQLARRIVKLSLRANELSNAIQLSKEHVANVRNDKMKSVRLEKLNCQNRLKEQKKHYEEIVARHQTFIEQLIKDKAGLCEKVTQITRRIDSQNQAWEHRLKTEVDRAKETAAAGEKIRREKWVRENTKKIKELTVKGLELEINRMTANHKQEIEDLKRQHQLDLIKAVDDTKGRFEKIEQKIRDSYADERESAIERERKAIKERYEKQMDDERKSFEQQRIRMIHDFESEKDRIYAEMREKEHQFELKKEELINEKMEMLEDTRNTFKEKLKMREQKHESELNKLQNQYESDFKIWKREHETVLKLRDTERENTLREQYRVERDRQIDTIIAKIDAETLKAQQDFDIKFNRLKEKYEQEIKELENSEKNIKEKYIDSRTRLAEVEANNQNLQATNKSMELQLSHLNKLCEEYNREKDHLKDEARNEIKNELKSINREHESEIQRIYSRVQQAIKKKDATIEAIQKENGMLKERCLKLDAIIRQQRKDYCTK